MAYQNWSLTTRVSSSPNMSWAKSDEQIFNSLGPINGLLTGDQVKSTFQRSGLPSAQLANIWNRADSNKDGKINLQEFILAMNLIRQSQPTAFNRTSPLMSSTHSLPAHVSSTHSLYNTSTSGNSTIGTGGVGRGVSLNSLQQTSWSISTESRQRYNLMFNTNDKGSTGFINGDVAHNILTKSGLDQTTLRKIWELSDVDKDGRLSSDEFAIAMFLVERAVKGQVPPTSLPSELVPSKTPPPVSPGVSWKNSFEDKKKENFDMGRAELERRRKLLLDEENKAKEEREKKRLAEEERKRQQQLREEQLREAELERQRQKALEIERERQRVLQQALLQREAEAREAERKRKEEWTRRRLAELEEERKKEIEGLSSLKAYHQDLLEQLTKIELHKRTIKLRAEQCRVQCSELAKEVDTLKQNYSIKHTELMKSVSDVKVFRQERNQLEGFHRDLRMRLSQTNESFAQQGQLSLMDQCHVLSNSLSNLKLSYTQQVNHSEQLNNTIREKQQRLKSFQEESILAVDKIKQLELKKQEYLRLQEQQQKKVQEEKQKKDEVDRRKKAIEKAKEQQKALEDEIKKQKELDDSLKKKQATEDEKRQTLLKKANEALKKQQEMMSSPRSRSKSPQPAPPPTVEDVKLKEQEMKRKVAELQQRKKQLQRKKEEDSKTTAIQDLKGINLSPVISTPPSDILTTPISVQASPIVTHAPPATTQAPPPAIYESLDDIQSKLDKKPPPVQTKPSLPPKPSFLKHGAGANKSEPHPPPIPPKPRPVEPPVVQEPPAVIKPQETLYEIIDTKPTQVQEPHPPLFSKSSPIEIVENLQQKLSDLPSPEAIYDLPPDSIGIVQDPLPLPEPLYDFPPDSISSQNTSTPVQDPFQPAPLHDLPPSLDTPPQQDDSYYGNIATEMESIPNTPIPAIAYRAKYSFSGTDSEEISFVQGAVLTGCTGPTSQDGWIRVKYEDHEGWAPLEYLQPISSSDRNSPTTDTTERAIVQYTWETSQPNQLSIVKGDIINIRKKGQGWWMGEKYGMVGWFPGKYVQIITETHDTNQYKANFTYEGNEDGDLAFTEGDIINVVKKEGEWWVGEIEGRQGLFPSTYVSPVTSPVHIQLDTANDDNTTASSSNTKKPPLVGRVIVGFIAQEENQLGLVPGQLVLIRRQEPNGWWEGQLQSRGLQRKCGWFPSNRIELLTPGGVVNNSSSPLQPSSPMPDTVPSTGGLVLALYSYVATSSDELSFHKGSVLSVLSKDEGDWWKGELNGKIGLFPSNYVQPLDSLKSSEASNWSDMVSSDIADKIPAKQKKRQEAIFELIQTEKAYVHSLNLVKEVFFVPMENSTVFTEVERQQVIVNWEELITCNSAFLNSLLIRLRTSGGIIRSIGDILQEHIPNLIPHIRWCSCQLNACTLLQAKTTDPSFKEFEQQCLKDSRTGGLPLSSFLLKPMQRVTKYPLLIGKIIEYTPTTDNDYDPLLISLQESETLCSQVNEGVRQKENSEQLEWLQSHVQLTLNEKLVFNSQTNFMGSRRLLHWGKVIKVRGNKEMVGFLFNDFLLLTRPNKVLFSAAQLEPFSSDTQFTMYRQPFLLDQIQAKAGAVEQYGPNVFIVMSKSDKKEIPLKSESDVAREKWIKQIMEACVSYVRKQKQQSRLKRNDSRRMTLREAACGKLLVTVIRAADLIASADGKSDPFCVVKIGENQESATPVINNDLNPVWNYTMPEFLLTDPDNTILDISVFDSDLFSPNDFLGCAKVSLKELRQEANSNGPWTKQLLLEDVPKGELELRITYKPHFAVRKK